MEISPDVRMEEMLKLHGSVSEKASQAKARQSFCTQDYQMSDEPS